MRTTIKYGALLVVAMALLTLVHFVSAASLTATPSAPAISTHVLELGQTSSLSTTVSGGSGAPYTASWQWFSSNITVTNAGEIPVGEVPVDVAFSPDGSYAYVTDYNRGNISIIDTATMSVVGTVNKYASGMEPWGVAFNPVGNTAYVANFHCKNMSIIDTSTNTVIHSVGAIANCGIGGVSGSISRPGMVAVNPQGTFAYFTDFNSNNITVVNIAMNSIVASIGLRYSPGGYITNSTDVVFNPAGTLAYATTTDSQFPNAPGNVMVINVASNSVTSKIPVGAKPYGIAINPSGTLLYVTSYASGTVNVINTASDTVINTINVGLNPWGVSFNPSGTLAYVVNKGSNNVSVIDVATNTVVKNVNVGRSPLEIAINPSGTIAFVTDYNNFWFNYHGAVSVINLTTNTVLNTINIGNSFATKPQSIILNKQGTLAYTTNYQSNTVSVIDTATNTIVNKINVGKNPQYMAINPSGTLAYVTNSNSSTINVINVATNTVIKTITVGSNPIGVAFNPSGTLAYVANYGSGTVKVINVATNTVINTITVQTNPWGVTFNSQGTLAYVTNYNSGYVSVINVATNTVATSIYTGYGCTNIAANPTLPFVYVMSSSNGYIAVINTATNTVIRDIYDDYRPMGIAFNPQGTLAYVTVHNNDVVSIIATATNSILGSIPVGSAPSSIAINPSGTLAYVTNSNSSTVSVIKLPKTETANQPLPGSNIMQLSVNPNSDNGIVFTFNGVQYVQNSIRPTKIYGNYTIYGIVTDSSGANTLVIANVIAINSTFTTPSTPIITSNHIYQSQTAYVQGTVPNTGTPRYSWQWIYSYNGGSYINAPAYMCSPIGASYGASVKSNGGSAVGLGSSGTNATGNEKISCQFATNSLTAAGTYKFEFQVTDHASPSVTTTSNAVTINVASEYDMFPSANPYPPTISNSIINIGQETTANTAISRSSGTYEGQWTFISANMPGSGYAGMISFTDAPAQFSLNPAGTTAYFTDSYNGGVRIVNLTSGWVMNTVNTLQYGSYAVAANPSGSLVYASGYNDSYDDIIVAINTTTNKVVNTILIGGYYNAEEMAFNPSGTLLYATIEGNNTVMVINTATNTVVSTITTGSPYAIAFNPSGTKAYVTSYSYSAPETLNTIDVATNTIVNSIKLGGGTHSESIALNPAGTLAYVTNCGSISPSPYALSVNVVNLDTNTVIATIPGGGKSCVYSYMHNIRLNPSGTLAYLTHFLSDNISIIDTATNTVVNSISTIRPYDIAFNPSNGEPEYSLNPSGISPINPATNAIESTINVGLNSTEVVFSPTGKFAYVMNGGGVLGKGAANSLNVVSASTNTVIDTISFGTYKPTDITFNPSGTLAYVVAFHGAPAVSGDTFNGVLYEIDTATNAITNTIGLGKFSSFASPYNKPMAVSVNPSGTFAYVLDGNYPYGAKLLMVDLATKSVTQSLTIGGNGRIQSSSCQPRMAMNPQGTIVYVANTNGSDNYISVIDTATAQIVNKISTHILDCPQGLTFDPTGKYAYYVPGEYLLQTINVSANALVASQYVASQGPIEFTPSGALLYMEWAVQPSDSGGVVIINPQTDKIVDNVYTGGAIYKAAMSPSGTFAYVPTMGVSNRSFIAITRLPSTSIQNLPNFQTSNGLMQLKIKAISNNQLQLSFNGVSYTENVFPRNNTVSIYESARGDSIYGKYTLYAWSDPLRNSLLVSSTFTIAAPSSPCSSGSPLVANPNPEAISNGSISIGQLTIANTVVGCGSGSPYKGEWTLVSPQISNATKNIYTGGTPLSIAVDPKGTVAYVSNESGYSIEVIDLATNSIINSIPSQCNLMYDMAFNPSGTLAYVPNWDCGNVSVIDVATNTIVNSISTGSRTNPMDIAINPSGTLAYVTDSFFDSVYVIDLATNSVINTIDTGSIVPQGVAFNPSGALAYVVNNETTGTVNVIDVATNTVIKVINVGHNPSSVAFAPSGLFAYVTNAGSNTVSVIDTATNTVVNTISVGKSPSSVIFDSSGTLAFVTNFGYGANYDENNVSVIDTATNMVIGSMFTNSITNTATTPIDAAINPSNTFLYVANYGGNNVSVINLPHATETNYQSLPTIQTSNGLLQLKVSAASSTSLGLNFNGISYTRTAYAGQNIYGTYTAYAFAKDSAGTNTIMVSNTFTVSPPSSTCTPGGPLTANPNPELISNAIINIGQLTVANTVICGGAASYKGEWAWVSANTANVSAGQILLPNMTLGYNPYVGIGLSVNPSGTLIYAPASNAVTGRGYVDVVSTATGTVINSIEIGGYPNPQWAAFNPQGTLAYIANPYGGPSSNGNISVIDVATNTVVNTIANTGPSRCAGAQIMFNPAGTLAYSPCATNTVVIDVATNTVVNTLPPGIIAIDFANNVGYSAHSATGADSPIAFNEIDLSTGAVINSLIVHNGAFGSAGIALNPSGTIAYMLINSASNKPNISVINTVTHTVVDKIQIKNGVGGSCGWINTDPTGSFAYTVLPSGFVDVINLATNTITKAIGVGSQNICSTNVAFNPVMNKAYLYDIPYNSNTTITTIDTATNTAYGMVTSGGQTGAVTFNPSGTLMYVLNSGNNTALHGLINISVIDTATNATVNTIQLGYTSGKAKGIAINPSGSLIYVAGSNSLAGSSAEGTINVISTSANSVVNTISLGRGDGGNGYVSVAFNPQGTLAYADNALYTYVINVATNSVINTISTPNAKQISFTPSGAFAYTAGGYIINVSTNTIVNSIAYYGGTVGQTLAMNPQGNFAYVGVGGGFTGQNIVEVVSLATNSVVKNINTNLICGATSMNMSTSGVFLFISDYCSGEVGILDTMTNSVIASVPVGGYVSGDVQNGYDPRSIGTNPAGTRVYVPTFGGALATFTLPETALHSLSSSNMKLTVDALAAKTFSATFEGTQYTQTPLNNLQICGSYNLYGFAKDDGVNTVIVSNTFNICGGTTTTTTTTITSVTTTVPGGGTATGGGPSGPVITQLQNSCILITGVTTGTNVRFTNGGYVFNITDLNISQSSTSVSVDNNTYILYQNIPKTLLNLTVASATSTTTTTSSTSTTSTTSSSTTSSQLTTSSTTSTTTSTSTSTSILTSLLTTSTSSSTSTSTTTSTSTSSSTSSTSTSTTTIPAACLNKQPVPVTGSVDYTYSTNTAITSTPTNCRNLVIDSGVRLTVSNGASLVCSGTITNYGTILVNSHPLVSASSSYGGSGGAGGNCTTYGATNGQSTTAQGGLASTSCSRSIYGGNGNAAYLPTLTSTLIDGWYNGGISNYLGGGFGGTGGGSGSVSCPSGGSGGLNNPGIYIQASKIVAGKIIANGYAGESGYLPRTCGGGGGGGGGVILLSYEVGNYIPGTYSTGGGSGGYPGGGSGGSGQVATFCFS